jgi:hypothetical protein
MRLYEATDENMFDASLWSPKSKYVRMKQGNHRRSKAFVQEHLFRYILNWNVISKS